MTTQTLLNQLINSVQQHDAREIHQPDLRQAGVLVAITDELLARLIHVKRLWQSLSSQIHGERVPTVVGEVHFPDLDCVVRQEVMPLELEVSALRVKSKNFSIVIQELFLGWNAATAELLFEEL